MPWRHVVDDDPGAWLGPALGVNLVAPGLTELRHAWTEGCRTPTEQACAIFARVAAMPFVVLDAAQRCDPDRLAFQRCGDAYSKATLMLHLLRGCRIPTRLRWVEMAAATVTRGLWDFLKHTDVPFYCPLVEIWTGQRWVCTDAYVIDPPLLAGAQSALAQRGWRQGFLVHIDGVGHWDGQGDAWQRFSFADPASYPIADWGCHHSHADFLRHVALPVRDTALTHQVYARQALLMNEALEALREPGARGGLASV